MLTSIEINETTNLICDTETKSEILDLLETSDDTDPLYGWQNDGREFRKQFYWRKG